MSLFDGLEGRSAREIDALARSVMGAKTSVVHVPGVGYKKIKIALKQPKIRRTGLAKWGIESKFDQNLNRTVEITLELPAYMVVGLEQLGGVQVVRDLIRRELDAKGLTWYQPRFVFSKLAEVMETKNRFTRSVRGSDVSIEDFELE